jgi:hypothetical protein
LSLHAIPFELAELERVVVWIEVDCAEVIDDFELFPSTSLLVPLIGRKRWLVIRYCFIVHEMRLRV